MRIFLSAGSVSSPDIWSPFLLLPVSQLDINNMNLYEKLPGITDFKAQGR